MRRFVVPVAVGLFTVIGLPIGDALADEPIEVGDTIELKATHHLGVPLHPDPDPPLNTFERVPDRAQAEVLEVRPDPDWFRVRVQDGGREGWISGRYVLGVVEDGAGVPNEGETEIWASPESCETALQAGKRMVGQDSEALRVGTWNIRWFPKGCSSQQTCLENATDLEWLACIIAWMDLDILALQEILDRPDDRVALAIVTEILEQLTSDSWESNLNECGGGGSQHVGYLWNADRVTLSNFSDEEQLNGRFDGSNPCAENLRPGRYARVTSKTSGGADFHLLSLHLDSGRGQKDWDTRRAAIGEVHNLEIAGVPLPEIGDLQVEGAGDNDILLIGDWNTMGRGIPDPVSAVDEIALFDEELHPGFHRLPLNVQCSEYFHGHGGLLDHFVPSHGMEEIASTARVTGMCAELSCGDFGQTSPAAFELLSDHCPIVVEIRDEDLDEPSEPESGYYSSVNTTSATLLRQTLHELIDDHTRVPYTSFPGVTDTWTVLRLADQDPEDEGRILDVYKNSTLAKTTPFSNKVDREHSWPKSYGFKKKRKSNYPYSDCHALFLASSSYNRSRSNNPYRTCRAECDERATEVNHGVGGGTGDYPGNSNWREGSGTSGTWETWFGRRGDVARAQFYMDVRYEGGRHGETNAKEPDLILTDDETLLKPGNDNKDVAHMGVLSVLLEWHKHDPVDDLERRRNEIVFGFQGNRNPFIDHPEWVACVFRGECP